MLKCLLCGFESENLSFHIIKIHGMNTKDYKEKFSVKYLQSDRLRNIHKESINLKNPTKEIGHSEVSIIKMSNNRKGKGIGNSGKYTRTKEIKEKISKGVVAAHFRGDFDNIKPGNSEFVFSHKMKKTFFTRSTWEANLIKIFDLHPRISSFDSECLSIPYIFEGSSHIYIPDYLVVYDDCIKSIWEVKRDDFIKNDAKTIAKIEALSNYCIKSNINMFIVDSKILKKFNQYLKL